MLCCSLDWKRYFGVLGKDQSQTSAEGHSFSLTWHLNVLWQVTFLHSLLGCPTWLSFEQLCTLSSAFSSGRESFLLSWYMCSSLACHLLWLRISCCVVPCRCGLGSHPSENWKPGFKSLAQAFWMWCIAWRAIWMLVFQIFGYCGGNEGNQKRLEKGRKILLSAKSASSPRGIKLRCSLNSSTFQVWSAYLFNEWWVLCLRTCAEAGWSHVGLST